MRPNIIEITERMDAWENALTQLGIDGRDHTRSTTYSRRCEIGDEQRWALYEEDAIFSHIVDVVPEHATRRGITIQGQGSDGQIDDDFGRSTLDAMDELDWQTVFYEALRLDRLDGGSVILIGADDGQDPSMPINFDRIKSVNYLNALTRYDIFPGPRVDDPKSPEFRQPAYYSFTPGSVIGGDVVHPSRVIRFSGINASYRSSLNRDGWGLSIAPRIYDAARRWGTIYAYVEALFKDLVQGVYTIKGLAEMLSADDGTQKVMRRLRTMSMTSSAFNAVVLDGGSGNGDEEKYERRSLSVTGFSDLVLRCMDQLSAVSQIPLSILFGQSPSGLSTDDKSGRTAFYDAIANKQRRLMRPPLMRVIEALVASKKGPTKGKTPDQWDFSFLPLEEPSDKEDADARAVKASTDKIYHEIGVVTPEEIRGALANDPHSPYMIDLSVDIVALAQAQADQLAQQDNMRPQDPSADAPKTDAYNPDQPRAADGKFGEGGGGSNAGSKKGAEATITHKGETHKVADHSLVKAFASLPDSGKDTFVAGLKAFQGPGSRDVAKEKAFDEAVKKGQEAEAKPSKESLKVARSGKTTADADAKKAVTQMFGKGTKPEHIANALGIPEGHNVHIITQGDGILVSVNHLDSKTGVMIEASRRFTRDADGSVVVHNNYLAIKPSGEGRGLELFDKQVQGMRALGVKSIETEGARSKELNGYYTWPRLGYDGDMSTITNPSKFPGVKKVSELMRTQEGRDKWKKDGGSIELSFDLRPGSKSLKILEAYKAEKAKRSK